ncbi:phosphoribosyltransferase [bacterium]|nr:phosphoribosyltransferase [bacterium]
MNATFTPRAFANRREAGRLLAEALRECQAIENPLILALPRGGVPVAAEIARSLKRPFDVWVVRKLGVPGQQEVALGAIASGGVQVLNQALISRLDLDSHQVETVIRRETGELARREKLYLGGRPLPSVAGRTVWVIDDGVATGSTMSAAVQLLRHQMAERMVVAVPVAPPETARRLREVADAVVTLLEPESFRSVGEWYDDFTQISDEQVQHALTDMFSVCHRQIGRSSGLGNEAPEAVFAGP